LSTGVTNGGESSAGVASPGTGEPGSNLGPGCVAGGAGSSGPAENGFAGEANGDRIPIVVTVGGFFAAIAVLLAYLCRRRLCAISRTLKKSKEKEELAKKSNQSQLSSTLTDDSRNSMVMQQWQGPVAFANRYVPWERDQQLGIVSGMKLILRNPLYIH